MWRLEYVRIHRRRTRTQSASARREILQLGVFKVPQSLRDTHILSIYHG